MSRGFIAGKLTAFCIAFVALVAVAFSPAHAALDGNSYDVIAPTYLASSGSESYVRMFNGGSATSTFTLKVVGTPSGTLYGTATYQVAKNVELQRSLSQILTASASPALNSGDTGYSIYLQNPDSNTGYQHVVFSSITTLFENATVRKTPLNQGLGVCYSALKRSFPRAVFTGCARGYEV